MRKSIEAIKGDKLQNIRNEKIYEVAETIENSGLLLMNVDTGEVKVFSMSNLKRWFKVIEEYVAPVETVETVEDTVEVDTLNDTLTQTKIDSLLAELGLISKVNKSNVAIRLGKKNVMELTYSKRKDEYTLLVRQDAITDEYKEQLVDRNNAKIVGGGTYTLDFSIKTRSYKTFKQVLNYAKNYQTALVAM